VLFISEEARLSYLVNLPEREDLGAAVDMAMRLVEIDNAELKDVLPRGYQRLEKSTLVELLRLFAPLPRRLSGDAFGLIYEDFLSNFAMAEGRLGGEFFTPHSVVRLIVEIIEPFHGGCSTPRAGRAANAGATRYAAAGESVHPWRDDREPRIARSRE
jgi:type I restriction enzyme M protein